MLRDIANNWWLMLLRGLAALSFGILAWLWPGITWLVLLTFYAAYCLIEGLSALSLALSSRKEHRVWWRMFLVGLVGIGAGIIAVFWPGLTSFVLLVIIASWAIIRGVMEISAAIQLRKEVHGEWMLILSGLLSIFFGCILLARPDVGLLTVVWMIAAFAFATGILLILFSLKLYHVKRHPEDMGHAM